ncbi:MAG: hypothetical protein P8174_08945 [Gemmatimonadota bacterium]
MEGDPYRAGGAGGGMVVLALAWTAYWAVPMMEAVSTQTTLGRSGIPASGLTAWQVLEVFFVAAHYGIFWIAGLVGLGATGFGTRQVLRRV